LQKPLIFKEISGFFLKKINKNLLLFMSTRAILKKQGGEKWGKKPPNAIEVGGWA
jgi:hypothetical protein